MTLARLWEFTGELFDLHKNHLSGTMRYIDINDVKSIQSTLIDFQQYIYRLLLADRFIRSACIEPGKRS